MVEKNSDAVKASVSMLVSAIDRWKQEGKIDTLWLPHTTPQEASATKTMLSEYFELKHLDQLGGVVVVYDNIEMLSQKIRSEKVCLQFDDAYRRAIKEWETNKADSSIVLEFTSEEEMLFARHVLGTRYGLNHSNVKQRTKLELEGHYVRRTLQKRSSGPVLH